MSIRIILTPLFGDDTDAAAAQAAFAVTRRLDAHVAGLFVRIDPLDAIPIVGEGISPSVIDDLTRATEAEMDRRSAAAKAHFEAARESLDDVDFALPRGAAIEGRVLDPFGDPVVDARIAAMRPTHRGGQDTLIAGSSST